MFDQMQTLILVAIIIYAIVLEIQRLKSVSRGKKSTKDTEETTALPESSGELPKETPDTPEAEPVQNRPEQAPETKEAKRLNGHHVYHALIEEPLKNAIQNHADCEMLIIRNNGEMYVTPHDESDILVGKMSTALPENAETRSEILQEIADEGLEATDENSHIVVRW